MAGHDAIAQDVVLGKPEFRGAMRHERVQLDERARIEEEIQALSRGQLAPGVLPLDANGAPTKQRFRAHLVQAVQALLICRQRR